MTRREELIETMKNSGYEWAKAAADAWEADRSVLSRILACVSSPLNCELTHKPNDTAYREIKEWIEALTRSAHDDK